MIFFHTQGKPPDWQDFVGIITLLVINSTISFIEENNAGNAAAALMARLAPKAKVTDWTLHSTAITFHVKYSKLFYSVSYDLDGFCTNCYLRK